MNALFSNENQMYKHIKAVGWIHTLLIPGAVGLVLLLGLPSGDSKASALGMLLPVILLVFGPEIYAGIGVLQRSLMARKVIIWYSSLFLIAFPIGTAIGAYSLWVLFNEETKNIFSDHRGLVLKRSQ